MYDSRIGRWASLDPKKQRCPDLSPYSAYANNPIVFKDAHGDTLYVFGEDPEWKQFKAVIEAKYDGFVQVSRDAVTKQVHFGYIDPFVESESPMHEKFLEKELAQQKAAFNSTILSSAASHTNDVKLNLIEAKNSNTVAIGDFRGKWEKTRFGYERHITFWFGS